MNGRRVLGWAAAALVAWLVGGWVSALTVLVVAVLDLLGRARPRAVLVAALVVLVALPFAWLVGNAGRLGRVSFDLVAKVPVVGAAGLVAFTLLCVGVTLDLLASADPSAEHDPRETPTR